MTLLHSDPRVISRVRETHKHAGIGEILLLYKLAAKNVIGEPTPPIPPQAHAAFGRSDTVGNGEPARAALLPTLEGVVREQRDESLFIARRRNGFAEIFGWKLVQMARLRLSIENLRCLRLKLNSAA